MHLSGFGKGGRAYIINEAHGLRKDALRQLLVLLERIPQHVTIIFTTTNDGEEQLFEDNIDAGPLLSRCICLNLARRDLAKPFAERAAQIAQAENLGSAPLANIVRLVQTHRNNFRAVLKAIQNGELLA
jgi:DNA polymerase III gamma/tau subunit